MKNYHPHEVFNLVIESVFKGSGRLQDRIQGAVPTFIEDKHFEAQLPKEIRAGFNKLCKKAMAREILKMDDGAALLLAKEIFHMYRVIEDHYYKEKYSRK